MSYMPRRRYVRPNRVSRGLSGLFDSLTDIGTGASGSTVGGAASSTTAPPASSSGGGIASGAGNLVGALLSNLVKPATPAPVYAPPSSGMSTGTMLMLGAGALGLVYVITKKK